MSLPRLVKIFCSAGVLPGSAIAPCGYETCERTGGGLCVAELTSPVSAGVAKMYKVEMGTGLNINLISN